MKTKTCGQEIVEKAKTLKIPELKIEVETEIHDKGKCLKDITIPKGWRLLKVDEIFWLRNSKYRDKLNLLYTWEFIEQPDEISKKNGYVAWFSALSDWAVLHCNWSPGYSDSGLGVRFCRDLKK
jgi:hypothetical protein